MVAAPPRLRPFPKPVIVPHSRSVGLTAEEINILNNIEERAVQCPRCKAMETLSFLDGKLISTRKFYEKDGQVYHDCGASEPCRVYKPAAFSKIQGGKQQ